MNNIKQEIINHFDNKNPNFKRRLIREFNKPEGIIENTQVNRYRDIAIYTLFTELTANDNHLFDDVDDLLQTIEETLFEHLCNK